MEITNIGGDCETCCEPPKSLDYIDSLIGKLARRKRTAETELAQCNAALEALKANPQVANLLELISKVGR